MTSPFVLLPYQQRFWADESPVIVWEKSRRIGASWTCAGKATELAATGEMDTYYVSYNEESGKDFVRDVAQWAKWYQVAHSQVSILEDFGDDDGGSESILVNRVQFANGRRIAALSSRPRSFRGKTGMAVLDEAAFLTDLPEFLKAVMAFRTWGGRVVIMSTHDGEANPFNELVLDIRAGKRSYSLHRTTLDDALRDGLFQRICYVQGKTWSPEAEAEWRAQLLADYGIAADEELHVIPRSSAGAVFRRDWFKVVDAPPSHIIQSARGWDFASTAPKKGSQPDFTRGLRGHKLDTGALHLDDLVSLQGNPASVKQLVRTTAASDTARVVQAIWQDPAQAGAYQADDIVTSLMGYSVAVERAARSKVEYARPVASFAMQPGKITIQRAPWNDEFFREISAFPDPHSKDDIVDALSRVFLALATTTFAIRYESASPSRRSAPDPWARDDDDDYPSTSRGSYL